MPFPVDPKYITQTEAELGVSFPDGFVERMRRLNGGELALDEEDWSLHPFADTSDHKRLKRTANNIVRETRSARDWRGFPAGGVSIASNGQGDHLVFLPDADHPKELMAAVFMWSHETGAVDKVAEDFSAFVDESK